MILLYHGGLHYCFSVHWLAVLRLLFSRRDNGGGAFAAVLWCVFSIIGLSVGVPARDIDRSML